MSAKNHLPGAFCDPIPARPPGNGDPTPPDCYVYEIVATDGNMPDGLRGFIGRRWQLCPAHARASRAALQRRGWPVDLVVLDAPTAAMCVVCDNGGGTPVLFDKI
jgi:hypothetical protein